MGSLNKTKMHGQTKITEAMKLVGLESVQTEAGDLVPTVRPANGCMLASYLFSKVFGRFWLLCTYRLIY